MARKKRNANVEEVEIKEEVTVKGNSRRGKGRPSRRNEQSTSLSYKTRSDQLVLDAANLSYASVLGAPMEIDGRNYPDLPVYNDFSVPGVMRLGWQPAAGISRDAYSALNVASKRLYSYVRHANSGHSNYDSPDLMLYVLAMSSLYSMHALGVRAYGIARFYQMYNRYVPESLMLAAGFQPEIQNNLADFRMFLNTMALKISSMAVPAEFDLFQRQVWLNSYVYKDSPGEKAQLYAFTQTHAWKYEGFTDKRGGQLRAMRLHQSTLPQDQFTIQTYSDFMNDLAEVIIADEDMNIMSGDILKAYGNEAIVRIGQISEDYQIIPEFNMEVLSEIQNSSIVPIWYTPDPDDIIRNGGVAQKDNVLYFQPEVRTSGDLMKGLRSSKILTLYKDYPTPEDTMVATRNMVFVKDEEDAVDGVIKKGYRVASAAANILNQLVIYGRAFQHKPDFDGFDFVDFNFAITNSDFTIPFPTVGTDLDTSDLATSYTNRIDFLTLINKFQMHPTLNVYTNGWKIDHTDKNYYFRNYFGDVDTYTQVRESTVRKMHDASILSMLHVEGAYRR